MLRRRRDRDGFASSRDSVAARGSMSTRELARRTRAAPAPHAYSRVVVPRSQSSKLVTSMSSPHRAALRIASETDGAVLGAATERKRLLDARARAGGQSAT